MTYVDKFVSHAMGLFTANKKYHSQQAQENEVLMLPAKVVHWSEFKKSSANYSYSKLPM